MTDITATPEFQLSPAEVDAEIAKTEAQRNRIYATIHRLQNRAFPEVDPAEFDALYAELVPLHERVGFLESIWAARGRWSRAYLVTSSDGHVHSSLECSTCYSNTRYGWITEQSDKTEAELVEAFGDRMCTVCFPTAPVVAGNRGTYRTEDELAKEARLAEKAAKKAAKDAKKIFNPDGSVLRDTHGFSVETEVSAQNRAVRALVDTMWYSSTHPNQSDWLDFVERAIVALAHKRGVSQEETRALIEKKAAAKYKRDSK